MSRATREQIRAAARYARENPTATGADIAREAGISESAAQRARNGQYDHMIAEPSIESPFSDLSGAAGTADTRTADTGRAGQTRASRFGGGFRPKKKKGSRRAEPDAEAVDSLYEIVCVLTSVFMAPLPGHLKFTQTDQEMIMRPLTRMYLRRNQSMPEVSPDVRDMMTVAMGAFGYGLHAVSGRYAGRDSSQAGYYGSAAFGNRAGAAPPAGGPTPSQPSGFPPRYSGEPSNGDSDGATYDPQAVMDRLGEELRAAAEQRAAEEATVAAAGGASAGGQDA